MDAAQKRVSKVEIIKENSRGLRGSIKEELGEDTSHFTKDATQLLKFHGIYQQEDRDRRQNVRQQGGDKDYFFMIRSKIPGGVLSPEQYLVHDDLASQYANGTIRITTRQDFQLHGVLKGDLKDTMQALNEKLVTTLGACGDVERNIMYCPAPTQDRAWAQGLHYARLLSNHLLPRTSAYYEIWLDGEKVVSTEPEEDPIYGRAYLPRKFKTGIAFPGDNCIDVYSQDIGIVAVLEGEELAGFNILVGGGMGMTHGMKETYPRVADPVAFVKPEELVRTVETIIFIQRDFGDRANRKHARLKYLVQEWGVQRFQAEMEQRLGWALKPPRELVWQDVHDHLGWHPQGDGRWFLGVWVENGRIKDTKQAQVKTAFRRLVEEFHPEVRLTPQQNVLFTNIAEKDRPAIESLLRRHSISAVEEIPNALRYAMACPALPTCGLAITDAERALPTVVRQLQEELVRLGLDKERLSIRMTGCPNGCARPFLGDIGFVGRTANSYSVFVGGDFEGTRLNQLYADLVPVDKLTEAVVPLLVFYREARQPGEAFGDFCHRVGLEALRQCASSPAAARA